MKRWPRVRLPDSRPSTFPGTSFSPCSITRPCTGRTNCASPAPQRITFGIGSDFSASSTSEASTSSSCTPVIFARATKTSPFAPARRSSLSTATPCFFAKPATACAGAEVDGPATSDSRSCAAAATSAIDTASRRGVAKMRMFFPETSCPLGESREQRRPERLGKRAQRLRRQLLGEELDEQRGAVLRHGPCTSGSRAARAIRSRPAPPRARARARGRCRRRAR